MHRYQPYINGNTRNYTCNITLITALMILYTFRSKGYIHGVFLKSYLCRLCVKKKNEVSRAYSFKRLSVIIYLKQVIEIKLLTNYAI